MITFFFPVHSPNSVHRSKLGKRGSNKSLFYFEDEDPKKRGCLDEPQVRVKGSKRGDLQKTSEEMLRAGCDTFVEVGMSKALDISNVYVYVET